VETRASAVTCKLKLKKGALWQPAFTLTKFSTSHRTRRGQVQASQKFNSKHSETMKKFTCERTGGRGILP
jgi:hypothetical protein